ncbi:dynamin family protein [Breznakiellaceae bacterium SP9]
MITAQRKVAAVCEKVSGHAKEAVLADTTVNTIIALNDAVRDCRLVVPIIGAFSSGKSSLINSCLGAKVLPVAITPETSLATELHYSPEEFIEAVKDDGTNIRYKIDEIGALTQDAAQYSYARLYLNNTRLQEIEPLVLVDMPGFDSPLDSHNKAIMEYIERGCHYIVLSSVEEGTVTASLRRRLREIDGMGRSFSFFLSKTDLRPKESVDKLLGYFKDNLYADFDYQEAVVGLDTTSADEVLKVLKNLDADAIFLSLFRDPLLSSCNEVIEGLNLQINASKKDAEKIKEAIKEMQDSIVKLQKKADAETQNMQRKYSGGMVNDIVNDVGRALEGAVDELVSVAQAGNNEATSQRINEIVRSALSVSMKNKLDAVHSQIVMDFSESLKGLDKVMKDLDLDDNYIQGLAEKIQSVFTNFQPAIGNTQGEGGSGKNNSSLAYSYKAITGVLSVVTTILNPLLEVVILFLPEIFKVFTSLFGGGQNQQTKQKEALRPKFIGEIFPQIKSKIRSELPAQLEEQVGRMIEQVRRQYEEKIKQQKAEIDTAVEAKNAAIEETEKNRSRLEAIRTEVQAITNEVLEWA